MSSELLTDKYKPQELQDIIGNKSQIQAMKKWLQDFSNKKNPSKIKNGLLITGPPGIGKTSCAHVLLKEHNFVPIEFNASEVRSKNTISEKLDRIMNGSNILSMFNDTRKLGIIMDEIDGCGTGDRGGVTEVIKYINPLKKKPAKRGRTTALIPTISAPIICICNDERTKKIGELKKNCVYIKFKYPTQNEITEFVKKIAVQENLEIDEYGAILIAKHSQVDLRRCLLVLQDLKNLGSKKGKIKKKQIKNVIANFGKKEVNYSLFQITDKILNQNDLSLSEMCRLCELESSLVPLMVHENIIEVLDKNRNGTRKNKIKSLAEYYEYLSSYAMFEKNIYSLRNWQFLNYIPVLSCSSARICLNNFPKTSYQEYTNLKYTSVLSKTSQKFLNLKNMKAISGKLGITYSDLTDYSEIILSLLVSSEHKECIEQLKEKKIDFNDIEKLINFNHSKKYWNEIFSKDIKKYIKKLMESD